MKLQQNGSHSLIVFTNSTAICVDSQSCASFPINFRWIVFNFTSNNYSILIQYVHAFDTYTVSCLLNCSRIYIFLILFYTQRVINTHIFDGRVRFWRDHMHAIASLETRCVQKIRKGVVIVGNENGMDECVLGSVLTAKHIRRRLSMHARVLHPHCSSFVIRTTFEFVRCNPFNKK